LIPETRSVMQEINESLYTWLPFWSRFRYSIRNWIFCANFNYVISLSNVVIALNFQQLYIVSTYEHTCCWILILIPRVELCLD